MTKYPLVSGMKEKTRPPLVLVTWRDAEHEFGWKDGNTNIEPITLPLVYSVGWFIYSNKHGVKICQTWTVDNHAQTLVIPKNMIEKVEEIWVAFKATLSCTQCGEDHPAALDFHHVKRNKTNIKLHRLVKDGRFKKAYEEIKKCEVLCANCHRKLHYEERKKSPTLRGARKESTCQDHYTTQSSKNASPSACFLLQTYKRPCT